MITEALDRAGGVAYLVRQAELNPAPFLALLGKLLPREMQHEISGELTVRAEIRRELIDRLVVLIAQPSHQEAPQDTIPHQPSAQVFALNDPGSNGLVMREREQAPAPGTDASRARSPVM